ncbi:hypothetical protein M513_13252 [Trichuris suis]|uniref:Uncharacterized protein n=1 Tax=Trichuris suis TaxID=68888 RepID=A0A085LLL6_9BILA|nr:hypothetical protein M513_13252 [Trichuris suis]
MRQRDRFLPCGNVICVKVNCTHKNEIIVTYCHCAIWHALDNACRIRALVMKLENHIYSKTSVSAGDTFQG